MPIHYGFDFYYGLPAGRTRPTSSWATSRRGTPCRPDQLARRYTDGRSSSWPSQPRDRRFFMYLAHRDPHLDNFPSPEFAGRSAAGAYGDVIEQLDATVGDVMKWLRDSGLDQNTLVIFMSDNGPIIPPRGRARPGRAAAASSRARRAGCGCPRSCAGRRGSGPGAW